MDVYYRNDSMKSERENVSKVGLKAVLLEQYGVDLVLTKSRNKSRLDREGEKLLYTLADSQRTDALGS